MIREIKTTKIKKSILLRVSLLAFIIYVVVVMVNQQVNINRKSQELEDLNQQISSQDLANSELQYILDSSDNVNQQYVEKKARKNLGLADPSEHVFVNIAGS